MADHLGGTKAVSSAAASKLLDDDTPLMQLTIRLAAGAPGTTYFSETSAVTSTGTSAHGFLVEKDSFTWGPYPHGFVKANELFVIGNASTTGDLLFIEGVLK
jgi:hypothetical protein